VEFVENLTAEMHEISKGGQRIQYQPESWSTRASPTPSGFSR
jgi:hypothetical protein